ncbi:uncharacterized protein [Nicotiana tomentosiformis]|uniref:uncharacterized protein n=1 Tax=Nicotiana tomentosiformis TaxID=4098 RepID=UPI00388C53BE
MEKKKDNKSLGMYPLCITLRDFDLECSISNSNTIAGSSGTLKLIDMQTSPAIVEYENIIITEHMPNVIEFRFGTYLEHMPMKHYSVMNNYCLLCVGDNYTWHFKSTSINDSALFKVRKFNSFHPCSLMDNTYIQRKPTATVVDSMVIPKYADCKIIYTPKDIQTDMLSEHDVNLIYMQAWRAKEKAFTSIKGWEYCRPVVVVDGTFLKSTYRGIMLTASTMDAAGSILPVAYAVIDSGNDASWKWLFEQFKHAYGEKPNMCVVSDQNESILKATSIVYTGMPHYACMWHIWTNIRSKFKKGHLKLSELYFSTARSYMLDEFNERMSKIEEIDTCVKAYLYDIGYHRWSQVHATVNRTWMMTSNIAESLNAVTKDARELPIVELLEYMRTLLERWTNEKLLKAKGTFTYLGKKYNKELEDNRTLSQKMKVRASTDHIHTVIDGVKRFIVCLQNKRCSYGQFQLDELPCAHTLAALRHKNESYENYYSPYYTRESLLHTYEIPVDPLPDESKWNVPQHIAEEVVMPPTGKRQPRRPQKQRYKSCDELNAKKYKVSCGNCGLEGHNKRSCKNAPKRK